MDRLPPPVIPYAPLEVSELLPPTALKSPRATDPPELSLPSYRLNLLAAHNSTLYLAASDESVFAYAISRANGLSLVPVAAFPIVPPTPVNNVRVAPFPARFGGPALLLAGGDALAPGAPGSVSVLRLTPTAENPRTAETFYLRQKSAWGLSADAATGRVAVSTNSHCAAVLRVAEAGPDAFAEFAVPPLAGTHFGNIPCVSFSHSGLLLGSASIDTTFAVFDVAPPRAAARRLLQSPQRDPHDDEPAEYCWALAWIGPRTPRALRADDPAWPALFNRRKAASACSMLDALHDPSYAAADAAAAATAAASAAAAAATMPRFAPARDRDGGALPSAGDSRRSAKDQLATLIMVRGVKIRYEEIPCKAKDRVTGLPLRAIAVYADGWGNRGVLLGHGTAMSKTDAGMLAAEAALGAPKQLKTWVDRKQRYLELNPPRPRETQQASAADNGAAPPAGEKKEEEEQK